MEQRFALPMQDEATLCVADPGYRIWQHCVLPMQDGATQSVADAGCEMRDTGYLGSWIGST